jgi:uncharacterized FlaG/YvyC family protein
VPTIGNQLEAEIQRVVGPAAVQLRLQDQPDDRYVRVETAEAVWGMPPDDLLEMLKEMPDRAGVLALRQAADQHPRKLCCP